MIEIGKARLTAHENTLQAARKSNPEKSLGKAA